MRSLLCVLVIFCACGWADETGDRTAIRNAVAALNQFPQHADLFTEDANGTDIPDQLRKGKRLAFQMRPSPPSDQPTVVISHEPWGEATINFPGGGIVNAETANPRIESRVIRFITPEAALADGACTYKDDGGNSETTPLLFVMKKEGEHWKIASIRLLR